MSDVVLYEKRDVIGYVTINRPEAMNALSGEVQAGLREAWQQVENEQPVLHYKGLPEGEIPRRVKVPDYAGRLPEPIRKVIGDLSNVERTLVGLQLRPAKGWET